MTWILPTYYLPPDREDYIAKWTSNPLRPQPWECPRCHKIHGPQSMSCDCKPASNAVTSTNLSMRDKE